LFCHQIAGLARHPGDVPARPGEIGHKAAPKGIDHGKDNRDCAACFLGRVGRRWRDDDDDVGLPGQELGQEARMPLLAAFGETLFKQGVVPEHEPVLAKALVEPLPDLRLERRRRRVHPKIVDAVDSSALLRAGAEGPQHRKGEHT